MVLELRGVKGKKYDVFAEDEFYCRCYPKDVKELGFTEYTEGARAECSEEQRSFWEKEVFLPRAKRRVLFLLEKKEYTEAELKKKLSSDGYPAVTVEAVMAYVKELHYVNDVSFAERYALYLLPKCSERELIQKMMMKGFPKDLIKDAVNTAKETYRFEHENTEEEERPEVVAIRAFLRKKGYRPEQVEEEKKKKIIAALCRKGFSFSDIKEVMGTMETEEDMFY